jgi:uncharacterized membrane protein YeaQ/YmgE (transglycosylase-associated protein family)
MVTLHSMFADTVVLTANLFGYHIVLTLSQFLYLVIAAIVGLVAEFIVGWRLPLGIVGAVISALIGIWLVTHVVELNIPNDPNLYSVPLIKTLIGAIVFVALWHIITFRSWRPRHRTA